MSYYDKNKVENYELVNKFKRQVILYMKIQPLTLEKLNNLMEKQKIQLALEVVKNFPQVNMEEEIYSALENANMRHVERIINESMTVNKLKAIDYAMNTDQKIINVTE